MTYGKPMRVEADGTHVYSDYHRYRPVPEEERVNRRHKPDDPRAVRYHANWYLPLPVLPDEERQMPETRPDEVTLLHKARCLCPVCRRPAALVLWRRRAIHKRTTVILE